MNPVVALRLRILFLACAALALGAGSAYAQDEPSADTPYDFAVKRQFLENLLARKTFTPTYKITLLERLLNNQPQLSDPRLVHGILTYAYFAFARALQSGAGLGETGDWTEVKFPMAFLVFGPTEVVPWEEP